MSRVWSFSGVLFCIQVTFKKKYHFMLSLVLKEWASLNPSQDCVLPWFTFSVFVDLVTLKWYRRGWGRSSVVEFSGECLSYVNPGFYPQYQKQTDRQTTAVVLLCASRRDWCINIKNLGLRLSLIYIKTNFQRGLGRSLFRSIGQMKKDCWQLIYWGDNL